MAFKQASFKTLLLISLAVILIIGAVIGKFWPKTDQSIPENMEIMPVVNQSMDVSPVEEVEIQQQLNHDRQEQKQTKYLKTKLEQINLELEQEKALAEINKLKMENGTLKETGLDGQKGLPEIKVEYIGGNGAKKEAILSIAGVSFQVKEKSVPLDGVKVLSISDSSVTLHFSTPKELNKTIEYRPE